MPGTSGRSLRWFFVRWVYQVVTSDCHQRIVFRSCLDPAQTRLRFRSSRPQFVEAGLQTLKFRVFKLIFKLRISMRFQWKRSHSLSNGFHQKILASSSINEIRCEIVKVLSFIRSLANKLFRCIRRTLHQRLPFIFKLLSCLLGIQENDSDRVSKCTFRLWFAAIGVPTSWLECTKIEKRVLWKNSDVSTG